MGISEIINLCKNGTLVLFPVKSENDYVILLDIFKNIQQQYSLISGNEILTEEQLIKRWEKHRTVIVKECKVIAINYRPNSIGFGSLLFYKNSNKHFVVIPLSGVKCCKIKLLSNQIKKELI